MLNQTKRRALGALAVFPVLTLTLAACSQEAPAPDESSVTPTSSQTTPAEPSSEQAATDELTPYPLDVCLVSDEPLDSMGGPYTIAYEGKEISLCCNGCEGMFKKNPDKYLAKLDKPAAPAAATDDAATY